MTKNSCTDTSACINVTGVGITPGPQPNWIKFYPNPTQGMVSFELDDEYSWAQVQVFNTLGEEVSGGMVRNAYISNLVIEGAPGLYLVRVTTSSGEILTRKLFKEQ